MDVPPATYIRLDMYPAFVYGENLPTNPDQNVLDGKRVIITDTHMLIFSDGPQGPYLMYSGALVDIEGRNTIGWTVTTEEFTAQVKRSSGCGCGSKLRSLFPYPGVPHKARQQ